MVKGQEHQPIDGNRAQHLFVLLPILVVYGFLVFNQIEHQSLWVDEIITVLGANQNDSLLSPKRWFGGRGPLYHIVIQLWPDWRTVEFAFRSFSAFFGGVAICFSYFLARRLYGRTAAWITALLFATSPFLIWYGQEARYVSLAITAALVSMYTFHVALTTNRLGHWVLYCCSLVLAIGIFVVNLLLPLAQALYLMSTPFGRRHWKRLLLLYAVVFLLFTWWANDGHVRQVGGYWSRLAAQLPGQATVSASSPDTTSLDAGGRRDSNVLEIPYTFFAFSSGFSLGPSTRELQFSRSLATLQPHAVTLASLTLLFGVLFIAGLVFLQRTPEVRRLLALYIAVPVLMTFLVAWSMPGLSYNVRYVSMAFPPYLLIIAVGISGVRSKTLHVGLLAAVLVVNAVSLSNYYYDPHYAREDARSAARYLEAAGGDSDVIVVVGSSLPLEYYYKGSMPVRLFNSEAFEADASRYIEELRRGYDRLWLVQIRPWEAGPNRALKTKLNNLTSSSAYKHFSGVEIYAYELPG